ncbi:MAG: hypothetical protein ACSLFP_13625 [Acidimicrobiales bacterium]
MGIRHDDDRLPNRSARSDALSLFSVMWALASAWHLLGNPTLAPGWSQVLLALGVGAVLRAPGSVGPLVLLATTGLFTVWLESPLLGNHWLLAGLVNLALLVSVAVGAARGAWDHAGDLAIRFLPAARLCLLGFYVFAAFAKLNSAFFDRSVSCAVFYFRESTESLGLGVLRFGDAGWLEWLVIGGTAAIELSIPVLLVVRRTRHLGVVVGIVFHGVLALDQSHQFFDFSSVLVALFVLFLPSGAATWVAERVGSARARLALRDERAPRWTHLGLVAVPVAASLLVAFDAVDRRQALLLGWWPWQAFALGTAAATVGYLRQRPASPEAQALRLHHVVYAVVPLLVVLNGLTPYLEVKTAYGWNMYANLRTVDGDSNHFLVRATLPLTDEQADVVRIISSSDAGLRRYALTDHGLTWRQLRTYLADRPDTRITFSRDGEVTILDRAGDLPELVEPVPEWRDKVQLFRAVDLTSPERCVPTFGPAR